MDIIEGYVERKIFLSEQSGFGIFRIVLLDGSNRSISIKGPLYHLEMEETYEFKGKYEEDPRYGLQFKVETYEKLLPKERELVIKYLSGSQFPGIGEKSAQRIVEKYGDSVLDELRSNLDFQLEVSGISNNKLRMIESVVREQSPLDEAIAFLLAVGLSTKIVMKITKEYQDHTLEMLKENPYRLIYDINGIGFKTADKIANELSFDKNHEERYYAYVYDLYRRIVFSRGDSFIYLEEFLNYLDWRQMDKIKTSLAVLIERHLLVLDEQKLYDYTQYEAEVTASSIIRDKLENFNAYDTTDFDKRFNSVSQILNIEYDSEQKRSVYDFLKNDLMILSGGPGTGKSTVLSAAVMYVQKYFPDKKIALCAPTGRAAKRLTNLTNVHASTIHSLLKWDPEPNTFAYNELEPLDIDVLIIDEFSMVDIWLFANLLKASDKVEKILFVGDQDQLPSVGPGFVLGDLLSSDKIHARILEKNYRQEQGSEVIDLAMMVNKGKFDINRFNEDVCFYDLDKYILKDLLIDLVRNALERGFHLDEIQVLSPRYEGYGGIHSLNHMLQAAFNPKSDSKNERIIGTHVYREGDKMLQLKNQPDDGVYNGDIGYLEIVNDKELVVNFDGIYVSYQGTDVFNLSHAYCISVHKSQGSEYPVVILLALEQFGMMLSRRLYYTAITRSSKELYLLGTQKAFKKASMEQNENLRYTYLKERLEN